MNYHSINDLVELCHKNNAQIWQVIMMDNAHERMVSEDKIFENMRLMYKAMKTADNNYDKSLKSPSRMAGGDGELMYQYNKSGRNICGDFVGMVMEKALKMGVQSVCRACSKKRSVSASTKRRIPMSQASSCLPSSRRTSWSGCSRRSICGRTAKSRCT